VLLSPGEARALVQGRELRLPVAAAPGTLLRLRMQEGGFLGLGRVAAPGVVAPKRLVAQKSSE
jgi:hypothetical protein